LACPVAIPNSCLVSLTFREFVICCIDALLGVDIEVVFIVAWEIWNAKNRLHWEHKLASVNEIWQRAAALALDFKEAGLQVHALAGQSVVPVASRWRPPELNSYKLNMAFSMDLRLRLIGVGFLVRDADGTVLAALK
jgi:hypothetical protein